jgi:Reverse transcriptase (RNA-dependent DNA polymerase)
MFLYGNLQEGIYMKIPEGMMSANEDSCLQLKGTIYSLVQSAKEFYRKLVDVIEGLGIVANKSDPCLLLKWENDEISLIGDYVYDCLVIGKQGFGDEGFKVTFILTGY